MTDPFRPDDDLVSAVLDGEATADERARVAADPALSARLAEFAAAADRVAEPVAARDDADRDRAIAAAVAARHQRDDVVVALPREPKRDHSRLLAVAAAVLVVLAAAGLLSRLDAGDDSAGQDESASSDAPADTAAAEAALEGDDAGGADAADAPADAFAEDSVVDLGDLADEEAVRQALVSVGAVDPSTADELEDGAVASTTVPLPFDPQATTAVPGESEACQIALEEADPSLDGRLVRATATYAGQPAVVYVHLTGDGSRQVTVVTADACAPLAAFRL